ncbi:activity-dependent neuroprotector homeobox protein, partial [Arapaima gigas]
MDNMESQEEEEKEEDVKYKDEGVSDDEQMEVDSINRRLEEYVICSTPRLPGARGKAIKHKQSLLKGAEIAPVANVDRNDQNKTIKTTLQQRPDKNPE